jgi:hypothetical protein
LIVGAGEQRCWDREAKRLSRRGIDDQLKLCELLYGEIPRFRTTQDFVGIE